MTRSSDNCFFFALNYCLCMHYCLILYAQDIDVLVNTTNSDLGFGGFVSQALLKAAGKALKVECAKKAPVNVGDVAVTGAGNMKCKHIMHVVLPSYDGSGGLSQSEKVHFVNHF